MCRKAGAIGSAFGGLVGGVVSVVDWPLKVMEEERNLGSVESLHLEWQLYHVVLQMQRTYKHEGGLM